MVHLFKSKTTSVNTSIFKMTIYIISMTICKKIFPDFNLVLEVWTLLM